MEAQALVLEQENLRLRGAVGELTPSSPGLASLVRLGENATVPVFPMDLGSLIAGPEGPVAPAGRQADSTNGTAEKLPLPDVYAHPNGSPVPAWRGGASSPGSAPTSPKPMLAAMELPPALAGEPGPCGVIDFGDECF